MRSLLLVLIAVSVLTIATAGRLDLDLPQSRLAHATDAPSPRLWLPLIAVTHETPTPTATPPIIRTTAARMLAKVNDYRAAVGLPPVVENGALSDGAQKHAEYMILNWNQTGHFEDPARPGYTPEGDHAARNSDLAWGFSGPSEAVDGWMAGIYHRIWMTNRKLKEVGIGWAADGSRTAAVLNVIDGMVDTAVSPDPVAYPADGMTGIPTRFDGNETPDPIETCTGYQYPVGYIVSLQFEMFQTSPVLTTAELRDPANAVVPTCLKAPDSPGMYNTVALIPAARLLPAVTYTVVMAGTYRGEPFQRTWTFTTSGESFATQADAVQRRARLGPAPQP